MENKIFESACEKLGSDGVYYLEARSAIMVNQYNKGNERLAMKNEGRIDGYLRALEHSGRFTPEEMNALCERFM